MKIGLSLPQAPVDGGQSWSEILALAMDAEAGGADSLWVCDHFLDRAPLREVGYHEPFTLLSAVASATRTVELGTLVVGTSFRSAGLLAKTAATVDFVSGGRLVLGLGCGWHEPEYRAFGYPFDHRVGRFEEVVKVVRPLLAGERVTFNGRWTRAEDAVLLPQPARSVPIVIAAEGPRMLELAARHGDGWQAAWFGAPGAAYRAERARLQEACGRVGRAAPPSIHVGIEVARPGSTGDAHLPQEAAAIADGLAAWDAEGVDHVQLGVWPATRKTFAIALDGISRYRG